jgi:protein-tyrosine phosphatase
MVYRADQPMVDIHCHLLPGIDDGAANLEVSVEMARMAVEDGIRTVVVTPHQLGNFSQNTGSEIRSATAALQTELRSRGINLQLLPGADVRIEDNLLARIEVGEVVSLGDHRKHILLELPHELYFPLEPLLTTLERSKMQGILSHPERNQGILREKELVRSLVEAGCLMQITAGSLVGSFGGVCQEFCRWMLRQGLVHFVATDAHGIKRRRPHLSGAYAAVAELTDVATAHDLCIRHPCAVAQGQYVPQGRREVSRKKGWFGWRKAS